MLIFLMAVIASVLLFGRAATLAVLLLCTYIIVGGVGLIFLMELL